MNTTETNSFFTYHKTPIESMDLLVCTNTVNRIWKWMLRTEISLELLWIHVAFGMDKL